MNFSVNPSSSDPIYRQLSQQIREAIAQGRLTPEEQLPSVRELSKSLVVNPNTIARVYTELEREGVLVTRQGLGVFVAQPRIELTREIRKQKLQESLDTWLTSAVYLGFSAEDVLSLVQERVSKYQWDLVKGKK
ncbi:GntR family transcriptional regulator [Rubinisphaera margarita]|uniref:GntR family transcriptional regulator n=1 Tax=Rubinisphaera margarita TaxID=2909586 RepID=UPI001EE888BA|nr:GntR family transcriptional regulator [Rubinisphaera margarita]MCG6154478.1 GntR family transcriptional regulator [Rubinisphaera margarita]